MGALVVSWIRNNVTIGGIPYGGMEKRDFVINQTELSANCKLTHEPWACDKSIADRAHELKWIASLSSSQTPSPFIAADVTGAS